jgi:M6 family metalloprotease-like protein
MAILFMEYRRSGLMKKMSFQEYLKSIGFTNPAEDVVGMDDAARFRRGLAGPELIEIPSRPVTGKLQVKVLLVDFPDRECTLPTQHYEDMLFSKDTYPTGSMRDYYKEVSLGKVEVSGAVHGWLRMPNPYSYYTNNESGMNEKSYPHNAQRLAEDTVNAALQKGIKFEKDLDKLNQGIVTALFIIHAGQGAEQMHPSISGKEIWSHKWNMKTPVQVGDDLSATIYLTVPHDCKVGVCAHELGHLAFQWQDFYDPNYAEDGKEWDGSGVWDLMAGGSYNGDGARPAHPAGLHKLQHGWIAVTTVKKSRSLTIKPYTAKSGRAYKITSPNYGPKQYLVLENRRKTGFDFNLPGDGLLVWRIDEKGEMEAPDRPGMLLVQADGQHSLETPNDWNEGDAGDPFPGKARCTQLKDTGSISTSFPGSTRSGVTLDNIRLEPATGVIKLDVRFSGGSPSPSKKQKPAKGSGKPLSRSAKATRRR